MVEEIRHRLTGVLSAVVCALMMTGLLVMGSDSSEAYPDNAWIVGNVTDGANPVENAYVKAMLFMGNGIEMNWTMTDVNGDYSMMVPGGLQYVVFVAHGDYYMVFNQMTIDPGETVVSNFTLAHIAETADVTISGYVTDELGNPRSDGHVLGMVANPLGGDMPYYANVTTPDALGYFEVKVIPGPRGGGAAGMDFPGYPMAQNDTRDPFLPGGSYAFNIELMPQVYNDNAMVHGIVTDIDTGLPISSAIVSYESEQGMGRYSNWTMTNDTGYYEMGVQTGDWDMLTIQRHGYTVKFYWPNILPGETLQQDAALRKTTAVIRGNITDETTGDPIMFCRVFLVDNPNMEENLSFATSDASGYYELDAFEGSDLMFGADQDGYARNFTLINVTSGEDQWRDITLKPFSAWLVGQVTNAMSGAPIADASVHLMGPIELGEWTDGSGMYNMSLVPGDYEVEVNYWMGPVGFKTYRANITILDGVENVLNVALVPWDNALVKGHVYDVISSAAVSDADIWIIGEWWGNWTDVNMTGDFELYYVDGNCTIYVNAPGYQGYQEDLFLPEMSVTLLDIGLMPQNPATTTLLHGYVNNSDDHSPISGAEVRVRLQSGSSENSTWTDGLGYYEIYVVPWVLDVRVTGYQNVPFFGQVNLTGISDYALDVELARDLYEPNMTYVQSPMENISWSNPSLIQVVVQEENLREMTLLRFMEWNSSGLDSNWTMIDWKRTTFDPWHPESGLPYSIVDGNYSVNDIWDGTVQGGWLSNGVDSAYLPAGMWPWYMEPVYALSGFHTNATSPRTPGSALFNASTGAFVGFVPNFMGSPSVVSPDPTGIFEPQCLVVEYHDGWIVDFNWRSLDAWAVDDMTFTFDNVPPSGNYKSEFFVNDWGNSGNWSFVDNTVDHVSPTADAGPPQNVPTNSIVTLDGRASSDNVGIAAYVWEFYNATGVWTVLWGDVVTYSFESPGSYEVNLTVWDGAYHTAADSVTIDVFLDLPPVADAGSDQSVDEDVPVDFDGSGSTDDYGIVSYSWYISELMVFMNGPNPQYTFSDPGDYHVSLVVMDTIGQSSMPDEMVVTVADVTSPTADAGSDQYVSNGTQVEFDGSLSWDNVDITDYVWSFFDVMPVEIHGMTANHTFSSYGVYTVTLTVYDAAGNSGWDDLQVTVDSPPIADAGPDQTVDEDIWVDFDGSGSWDDFGVVEHTWFISELSVWMFGQNPQYWFSEPGVYHVSLVVADTIWQYSASDEMVLTVEDVTAPTADAGPDQVVLAGTPVVMNGSGSSDNVGIVSYVWSFFDVMPVELYGMEVSYAFTIDGSYVVTLNVTDAAGNWATDTLQVDIFSDAKPVADAGLDQTVDEDTLVTFDGSGSYDDNSVDNYTWTIIELGFIMYEIGPTYTFDNPGTYHVWLVVFDSIGQASDPDEMIVTVNDLTPPTAEAGPDQRVNNGTPATLDGTLSTDNGVIENYTWSFTDVVYTELYGPVVTYTFSSSGAYWVDLYIEDSGGNSATDGLWVVVNGPPIAGTMGDQWISPGNDAYFGGWWCWDDLDGPFDLEYTWTFTYAGSEVVLQDKNPDMYYRFTIAGEYTVRLTVKDTGGFTDNATMKIYVVSYMSAWWVDPRTGENIVDGGTIPLDYVILRGYVDSWEEVRVITPTEVYIVEADNNGLFEVNPLNLSEGLNIVTVSSYSDWWGDTLSWFKMIQSDTYCRLWVNPPESPTNDLTALISGWTDQGGEVTVNGAAATVLPDGTFSAFVSLLDGQNDVNVTATDSVGNMNWLEFAIWRDGTPPALTIGGPATGSNVSEPNVVVFGTVEVGASVMVNGVLAAPGPTWSVTVSLVEGANTIVVTATDSVGNSVSQVVVVNYVPPVYVTPEELAELRAEMLAEIGNLSAAMQENVTALQDQIDAAMDEIAALQLSLSENVTALQDQVDVAMDEILALQASLAENITALQAQIAAAMDEIAALQASVGENVTALQGQIDNAMADIVGLQASLLENVTALQTDIASAMADIVSLEAALMDNVTALQDQINEAVLDISGLQAALAENVTALESEIATLEAALQENVTALEQAIAANDTALQQALTQNVTALQSQIAALRSELQANVTSLTDALTENVTALQGLVAALDQNLADVQAELASVNSTLVAGQADMDAALDALQANMTDLQDQIDEIEQATQDVEETAGDTDSFASMLMYLTLILFAIAMVMIVLVWYLANKKFGKGGAGKSDESLEEVEGPTEVEKEFESLEKEVKDEEL